MILVIEIGMNWKEIYDFTVVFDVLGEKKGYRWRQYEIENIRVV